MSGGLKVEQTPYGTWSVTTSLGDEFRLNERSGHLEVRTMEGVLVVHPRSANAVELEVDG